MTKAPRVVILGGGFGGLETAKALATTVAEITLIDRQNHHCFQPLLYQVATASLSPADVAWPIRHILSRQRNVRVVLANVEGVDPDLRIVCTDAGKFPYDHLVVATGASHAYFGHDDWAPFAPGLKTIDDATAIRHRVLLAFEKAELASDPEQRAALTTFVIVGGGPTGVETAGAIAEMARDSLACEFRRIDPRQTRILLVEAGPRLLAAFPERLSAYARDALEQRGVEVITETPVTGISKETVAMGDRILATGAVIWAAGVAASPAAKWLGARADRAGRVIVEPDLTIAGHPEIFVIGDTASVTYDGGKPVPGVAPAAKQMGRYAGSVIAARVADAPVQGPFAYRHQGDLATIGRKSAAIHLNKLTLTGFFAWLGWSVAHIYFLIGLRNRMAVAFNWLWSYVTGARDSRLITRVGQSPEAD